MDNNAGTADAYCVDSPFEQNSVLKNVIDGSFNFEGEQEIELEAINHDKPEGKKEYFNLNEKFVEKCGVCVEEIEVIDITTVYTANKDISTDACLKKLLQNPDVVFDSITESESEEINDLIEEDVFLSSEDETNEIPNSQKQNDNVASNDKNNSSKEINLNTNGTKRKGTSIEQNSRKRQRYPEQWERNIRKKSTSFGQQYTSATTKQIVQARSVKESCGPGCRFKCDEKITDEMRQKFHADFWNILDHGKKYDFIMRHVSEKENKDTITDDTKRNFSRTYTMSFRNKSIKVCQTMFVTTLDISKQMINTAFKKLKNGSADLIDKRGTSKIRPRTNAEKTKSAFEHINMFPRVESHYVRNDTKREFLEEGLNISLMYSLYSKWAIENGKEIASKHLYTDTFNKKFNLGFFSPKKDQCDLCEGYKNANEEKKKELEEKYTQHISNKEASRLIKVNEKELAHNNENMCMATFDFQKVLTTPKTEASSLYYKRKLSVYNFTIFDISRHEGVCYVWCENDAKRGSNEVGSCLLDFIQKKVENGITDFRFWSDNCAGQNRNKNVFSMFVYASGKFGIDIKHSFLEVGHTQNEGDNVHAVIEKYTRKRKIFTQNEWSNLISNAKKTSPKYEVRTVTFDSIYNFKDLSSQLNWDKTVCTKKGKKSVPLGISKIKQIAISKEKHNQLQYRADFGAEFETLSTRREKRHVNVLKYNLVKAYTGVQGIPTAKLKDLLSLCKSCIIPPDYHMYYSSFPVKTNDDQDDDENEG